MGTDTQLRLFMHIEGTNLHLQHLAFRADHRRMQALVTIAFGAGDVIVEFLGHVLPQGMHNTQRGIAVAHLRHQNTHRTHVIDFTEVQVLFLHFPPDAVNVLGAPVDLGATDTVLFQIAA